MKNNRGIWFYIINFKFKSIFLKNFIPVILVFIIPISILNFIVYKNSLGALQKEVKDINSSSIYRFKESFDNIVNETQKISIYLSKMRDMETYAMMNIEGLDGFIKSEDNKRLTDIIASYPNIYNYINSIYLYSKKNEYVVSNIFNGKIDQIKDNSWLEELESSNNRNIIIKPRKMYGIYPYVLSIITPSYIFKEDLLGAVILNLDLQILGDMLVETEIGGTDQNLYVVNENNLVLYSNDYRDLFKSSNENDFIKYVSKNKKDSSKIETYNNKKYIVTVVKSQKFPWRFVSAYKLVDYNQRLKSIQKNMISFALISFIVAVIISFLVSLKMFQPVKSIISVLDNPDTTEHNHNFIKVNKLNEISYIVQGIINNSSSKKILEVELEKRLKIIKKAQALALQSQINPHFLYNTLETINWKAVELTNGANDVSKMISLISKLLKTALDMENYIIPLKEELDYCKLYLNLLTYRYKDLFEVLWKVDEEVSQFKILKLSLQPILENAIYHGIKPKREHGRIEIFAYIKDDILNVEVYDNGLGMDEEQVISLNNEMKSELSMEGEHIGIKNVNQRIKLLFGNEYGVQISSTINVGTCIKLFFPLIE